MEEKNDKLKREWLNKLSNPEYVEKRVKAHNELLNSLNQRVINILKVSPLYTQVELDEKGKVKDFKITSEEATDKLLKQIKKENIIELKKQFPDLYYIQSLTDDDNIMD